VAAELTPSIIHLSINGADYQVASGTAGIQAGVADDMM